jgi:MoxR-like ATPase
VGTKVFNPHDVSFSTRKGPLFANFVLADEINRAPAKVQSALLEAMQEHQVTIEGETLDLPKPFVVVATQNPLEHEGTYPLPEAQIDRFMFKTVVGYPTREQEDAMIDIWADRSPEVSLKQLLTPDLVAVFRRYTADVTMAPKIRQYILDLVRATRPGEHVEIAGTGQWLRQELPVLITHGASPRAVLALHQAARAWALCQGRQHVVPQDVQDMAYDVLRHRLSLSYEAEAENISSDVILQKLLETVPVP